MPLASAHLKEAIRLKVSYASLDVSMDKHAHALSSRANRHVKHTLQALDLQQLPMSRQAACDPVTRC